MKTTKLLRQIPSLFLVSGALIFSSCDNNNRNDRGTATDNPDNIETSDDRAVDTYELSETDYNTRRNRATANLENEINRTRTEADDLRQRAENATGEERNELQQRIDRLEARIENLENQQEQLENSNMDNWEETERVIETSIQDRDATYENTERRDPSMERRRGTEDRGTDLETGGEVNTGNNTETQTDTRRDTETNVGTPETGTDRSETQDQNQTTTDNP